MNDHCVAIVQARLGSTRFPRKVLADVLGVPMVVRVLRLASQISGVHTTIAAIPEQDEELAQVIESHGFGVFRGPSEDVLKRYAQAAAFAAADVIVRITADCPAISPHVAAMILTTRSLTRAPFVSNDTRASGYLDGMDVQVFSRGLLDMADREATDPYDREHVCPWMEHYGRPLTVYTDTVFPSVKLSVDTPEDLARVRLFLASMAEEQPHV